MAILQALGATARGITRVVKALLAAAITICVLAGIPWALLHYAGDPLPHSVPTMDAVKHTLTSAMTPQMLLKALSIVGWYLWAILAVSFAIELVAAVRRVNAPHVPTLGPTQALAAALITAIGLTALLRAAPAHAAEAYSASVPIGGRVAATAPVLAGIGGLKTAHLAVGSATSAAPRESVHTVKPGESLYSIAKEDLGNGDDWPTLYKLNAGITQPDGDKLTDPNLIRPDWKIRITASDTTPAPATASAAPAPHAEPPAPPVSKAPAPAATAPSALPTLATSGPSTLPAPVASAPVTHTTPSSDEHRQGDRAAKRHGGTAVSLPDGGTIGITLAVALGAALVLARRWRIRRNDPRLPVAEPPLPGALLAARRAQRTLTAAAHTAEPDDDVRDDEYDDLLDGHGIDALDDDLYPTTETRELIEGGDSLDEAEELDEFGAPVGLIGEPTVTRFAAPLPPGSISAADRDGVELPLAPTGSGLGLVGPGAAGAARAIAAGVLAAGAPDRTADLARLIIPAADLAALLGVTEAELPAITRGVPELFPTKDLAAAIGEAEVHALLRTRLLEEYEQPNLDALAAAYPDVEDCPPLVLMASPARALSAQIGTLINTSARLRITTILLGAHPDGPTAFVEAEGTATGPTVGDWNGARLWNLSATALADILVLLARAAGDPGTPGGQPEPEDWPETTPAQDTTATADGEGQEATVTVLPLRTQPQHETHTAVGVADDAEEQTDTESQTASEDEVALAPVTALPVRPASAPALAVDAARTGIQLRAEAALAAWEQNPVRISVLGGLSITAGGHPVSGLRTSARVLAALLAVKGSAGASAEQIDAMCWPDADPEEMDRVAKWRADGLNSLRKRLATAIGQRSPRLVLLDRATGRYRLNPELIATDTGTLAELIAAARSAGDTEQRLTLLAAAEPLCRGQLLDGELGDNLDWSGDYTATFADEQAAVLARLATLASASSQHDQAVAALEKATALTEDNEALYRQMFDILADAGRHTEIPGKLRNLEAYADSLGAGVTTATRDAAAAAMKQRAQPAGLS